MFEYPKLPTRKQTAKAVKGAAIEVARPIGAVVGVVVGALAEKTVVNKKPVRKTAKRRPKRKAPASRRKGHSVRRKKR